MVRLSFLFAFQRLVKLYSAAYPARFSFNVCIDRRSFLRVPWLFYCFRALPRLRFGHSFFCLVSCSVFL